MVTDGSTQHFIRLRSRTDGVWHAPPELKAKLVEEAEEDGSNMNEIARRILSNAYGVPFIPNGRRTNASPEGFELNLRLPGPLDDRVRAGAYANRRTTKREILFTLCAHYGLRLPEPVKRTRRRRPAAA